MTTHIKFPREGLHYCDPPLAISVLRSDQQETFDPAEHHEASHPLLCVTYPHCFHCQWTSSSPPKLRTVSRATSTSLLLTSSSGSISSPRCPVTDSHYCRHIYHLGTDPVSRDEIGDGNDSLCAFDGSPRLDWRAHHWCFECGFTPASGVESLW